MEQEATQQECQWTQLMLCTKTETFPGIVISHGPPLPRLNPLRLFSLGYLKTSVRSKAKNYRGIKTANSRWSGCNPCGDAAAGREQFQVPTWGMRTSKRKPSWGRYFRNKFSNWHKTKWLCICFSFMTTKQKIHVLIFLLKFSRFIAQPCTNSSTSVTCCTKP